MEFDLVQQQQPLWSLAGAAVVDVGEPCGQTLGQQPQPPLWSAVGAEVVHMVGTRPRHRVRGQ